MTEPTDAELLAEWDRVSHIADAGQRRLAYLRAVLAKWGTPPAVAGEDPLRAAAIELRDAPDLRAMQRATAKLYAAIDTTPQPTQAQAGVVPLTSAQIEAAAPEYSVDDFLDFNAGVRFAERHHGIKGDRHGESV